MNLHFREWCSIPSLRSGQHPSSQRRRSLSVLPGPEEPPEHGLAVPLLRFFLTSILGRPLAMYGLPVNRVTTYIALFGGTWVAD